MSEDAPPDHLPDERRWGTATARPGTAVLGIIRNAEGQVLLIHRVKQPYLGQWAFPGGALERGESIADAVVREIREETGLDARYVALRAILNERFWPDDGAGGGHFLGLACDLVADGDPVASDEGEVRWFSGAEIATLAETEAIAATDHAVLTELPSAPLDPAFVEVELSVHLIEGREVIRMMSFNRPTRPGAEPPAEA